MDPKRWESIQQVFHDALELPEAERPAFVHSACADDAQMEREVLALLGEDNSAESMLDTIETVRLSTLFCDFEQMQREIKMQEASACQRYL